MENSPQDLEARIVAIQQSTSTAFPVFARLHNYLRMKSRWYYNWHVKPYARALHISVAVAYLLSVPFGTYTYFSNPRTTFASSQVVHSSQADWQTGTVDNNLDVATSAGDIKLKEPTYSESTNAQVYKVFNYTTTSTPALPSASPRDICIDSTNNLVYITSAAGITALKTQGTADPADDTILTTYTTVTTPALASNNAAYCQYDSANHLLYIAYIYTSNKTIQVLDTMGTPAVTSDDQIATIRTMGVGTSTLYFDAVSGYIYMTDVNSAPNVVIMNTNGTKDTADDTTVHTKSLSNNYWVSRYYMDRTHNRLYIGFGNGVNVYNTQGTEAFTDDTLIGVYSASGTPGISLPDSGQNVVGLWVDEAHDLVYIGYRNVTPGMVVIHTTNSSSTLSGDTLSGVYNSFNMTSYVTGFAYDSSTNHLFVGTPYYGIYEIDTKGNDTAADDTLVQHLHNASTPSILNYGAGPLALDPTTRVVYGSVSGTGVTAISQNKYIAKSSSLLGPVLSLASTPSQRIRWNETVNGSHTTSAQTRTSSAVTDRNEFDDNNTSDAPTDYYAWGSSWGTATESNGTLKLSNPTPTICCTGVGYVDMWFDMGRPADYYLTGATITIRARLNSSTLQKSQYSWFYVFADNWEGASQTANPNLNEWFTITLNNVDTPFSKVGFEVDYMNSTWSPGDSLEIDYVEVQSLGGWTAWSSPCTTNTGCAITSDLNGKQVIQYQINTATTDVNTTPLVSGVTLSGGYAASGTYTSGIIDGSAITDWDLLTGEASTPSGTSIVYQTRSGPTGTPDGAWSDWQDVTSTIASPNNRYLQYKAVLSTSDAAQTPTLSSVTVQYDLAPDASGTPSTSATATPTPAVTSLPGSAKLKLSLIGLSDLNFANVRLPRDIKYATNNTKLTFSGNVVPGATVTVRNGNETWCVAVGDATGKWSCQLAAAVPLGDYSVRVGASLGAEKQNLPSLTLTLVADDQGHSGPEVVAATPSVTPSPDSAIPAANPSVQPYTASLATDDEGNRVLTSLKVTVMGSNGKPIVNTVVEMDPDPQHVTTDADGVATFSNVTLEKHTLTYPSIMVGKTVVARSKSTLDLATVIPDANVAEVTLEPIQVETKIISTTPVWWVIGLPAVLILIAIGLTWYWRDRARFLEVLRRMDRFPINKI